MARNERVSAVIPTRHRPDLVVRAVHSVLAQTYRNLEAIVILDGPDEASSAALATVADPRLRTITLPHPQGAQTARNVGIEAASGDWIALLDDDDLWLPDKIDLQMRRAQGSSFRFPILSSQFFLRTPQYELLWPRRRPYHPLCEYMLARDSLSMGEGWLHTSTLLFPKDLFPHAPFRPDLKRCHDVDWVLRATAQEGAGIEFVPQPLAVWHRDDERESITSVPDWKMSLDWVDSVRSSITPRAYASYLAITVGSQAARQSAWSAFPVLFKQIFVRGKPKLRDLAFFFGVWIVPRKLQLAVRRAGW